MSKFKKGVTVDYHSRIGGTVSKWDCTITEDPWDHYGATVCMIDKVRGIVDVRALTLAVGGQK